MKKGQLVKFCKNPPENINHCHMWKWCHGLLLNICLEKQKAAILFEGNIYTVSTCWVDEIDEKN